MICIRGLVTSTWIPIREAAQKCVWGYPYKNDLLRIDTPLIRFWNLSRSFYIIQIINQKSITLEQSVESMAVEWQWFVFLWRYENFKIRLSIPGFGWKSLLMNEDRQVIAFTRNDSLWKSTSIKTFLDSCIPNGIVNNLKHFFNLSLKHH